MKSSYTRIKLFSFASTILLVLAMCGSSNAQTSIDDQVNARLAERTVEGAQLGSLICQDASGKLVLCSGNIEESIAGIATNVPYVTLNKPATPDGNRSIFVALVDQENGPILKGDLLGASKGGTLTKYSSDRVAEAYAIALEDGAANGSIKVRVLNK